MPLGTQNPFRITYLSEILGPCYVSELLEAYLHLQRWHIILSDYITQHLHKDPILPPGEESPADDGSDDGPHGPAPPAPDMGAVGEGRRVEAEVLSPPAVPTTEMNEEKTPSPKGFFSFNQFHFLSFPFWCQTGGRERERKHK